MYHRCPRSLPNLPHGMQGPNFFSLHSLPLRIHLQGSKSQEHNWDLNLPRDTGPLARIPTARINTCSIPSNLKQHLGEMALSLYNKAGKQRPGHCGVFCWGSSSGELPPGVAVPPCSQSPLRPTHTCLFLSQVLGAEMRSAALAQACLPNRGAARILESLLRQTHIFLFLLVRNLFSRNLSQGGKGAVISGNLREDSLIPFRDTLNNDL